MQRADVRDVAAAFAAADPDLTAMKLQKLAYYVQAWHLASHDEPAFDDEVQAWAQGPVVRALYDIHQGLKKVARLAWGDPARLPASVRHVVELVRERYGHLSAEELSGITHRERPWRDARGLLPASARSTRPIQADAMRDFYRTQGGRRAAVVDDVLANARLEGFDGTPEDRGEVEAILAGRLSADQAVRRIIDECRR
jgi:uncharacterized phage-associated protein